jgi:hypothetical protein
MRFLPSKVYLLAGNHREALDAMQNVLHMHPSAVLSISSEHQLRGLRGVKLFVYGTYYARPEFKRLMEVVRQQDIKIEYLYDRDLGADTVPHPLDPGFP